MSWSTRTRDSRKRLIESGQRVAFNRSGDVVEGVVRFVGETGIVHIDAHPDFMQGMTDGKASRVRNSRSILVLDPAPFTAP